MMACNLQAVSSSVSSNESENGVALSELFEFYLLYEVVEWEGSSLLLKYGVLEAQTMRNFSDKLFAMLGKVRVNAVALVDAFDYLDSNLCIYNFLFFLSFLYLTFC
jgi:hypothetical protein